MALEPQCGVRVQTSGWRGKGLLTWERSGSAAP